MDAKSFLKTESLKCFLSGLQEVLPHGVKFNIEIVGGVEPPGLPEANVQKGDSEVAPDIRAKQMLLTIAMGDSENDILEKEWVDPSEGAAYLYELMSPNGARQVRRECQSGKILAKKNNKGWMVSSVSLVLFKHEIQDPRLVDNFNSD